MAAREISVKKYVVRLSDEERERLEALIRKGKSPAQRLLKARILLKADVSAGWSDSRVIKALDTSVSMVYRVRKQLVEEGFEAVLSRKQRNPQPPFWLHGVFRDARRQIRPVNIEETHERHARAVVFARLVQAVFLEAANELSSAIGNCARHSCQRSNRNACGSCFDS